MIIYLVNLLGYHPLALFIIGNLISKQTWGTLVTLICYFILTHLLYALVSKFVSARNLDKALLHYVESKAFALKEIEWTSHFSQKHLETLNFGTGKHKLYKANPTSSIRVFLTKRMDGGIHTKIQSYTNSYLTSYIFLNQEPKDDNIISKYQLFHEIGHVYLNGAIEWNRQYTAVVHSTIGILTIFGIAILGGFSTIPIIIPISILVLQTLYVVFIWKHHAPLQAEQVADFFAIEALKHIEVQPSEIDKLLQYWDRLIRAHKVESGRSVSFKTYTKYSVLVARKKSIAIAQEYFKRGITQLYRVVIGSGFQPTRYLFILAFLFLGYVVQFEMNNLLWLFLGIFLLIIPANIFVSRALVGFHTTMENCLNKK